MSAMLEEKQRLTRRMRHRYKHTHGEPKRTKRPSFTILNHFKKI
jgi:hypothetical protein